MMTEVTPKLLTMVTPLTIIMMMMTTATMMLMTTVTYTEWFSNDFRKRNTKVITLNQLQQEQTAR